MAKKFEITILGVNSAFPIHGRHPSCQILNYNDQLIMIDCGEAAQIQASKYNIKKSKINHVFISHLHGDHCYGLPGLLTSYILQGRNNKLSVHGPIGIKKFLNDVFEASWVKFPFELKIIEYNADVKTTIALTKNLQVDTFPLKHRVPTIGFRFSELNVDLNIKSEAIAEYKLTIEEIKAVKQGQEVIREGKPLPQNKLTFPKGEDRSYSYCSDTVYDPELVPYISNSTLLYHETTYLDDLAQLAEERMHTTLGQAIEIAKAANINKMVIGHYSSRYLDTEMFLKAGLPKFPGLMLGEEGRVYSI